MLTLQNLPPDLLDIIREVKRFSSAERLVLAKILLDDLVLEKIDEPADETNQIEDETVVRERKAYTALHPTLLKQYPNEYVAIYQGKLVDHDKDGLALSLRIYQRFPNEFVWIAPLKAQALEEWAVRSPRFEPTA